MTREGVPGRGHVQSLGDEGERVWLMTRTIPLPGRWYSPEAEPLSQRPSGTQSFLPFQPAYVDVLGES